MGTLPEKACTTCGVEFQPTREWSSYCSYNCRVNSPAKRERTRKFQQERRDKINQIKLDRGCIYCGYNAHPAALDFDHRNPEEKLFNISQDPKRAWNSIVEEIEKCDVVCANCHRITTDEKQHYHSARMGSDRAPSCRDSD